MWEKGHTIVTKKVTAAQMWKLTSDVNQWATWDKSVTFAKLEGKFENGNFFQFQPEGGSMLKIKIEEAIENQKFVDLTTFPLAQMYGEHLFEETPEGLKITTTMKVKGLLGFFWRKVVAQKIVDDLPADMAIQIEVASRL